MDVFSEQPVEHTTGPEALEIPAVSVQGRNLVLNHFPETLSRELTDRRRFVENFRNYLAKLMEEGHPLGETDVKDRSIYLDITPTTFFLPGEYMQLDQAYQMHRGSKWLVKYPDHTGMSIVHRIDQLKELSPEHWRKRVKSKDHPGPILVDHRPPKSPRKHRKSAVPPKSYDDHHRVHAVATRYITNPLTVFKKKCDLRFFVLVTSFRPLCVYVSKLGWCESCPMNFSPKSFGKLERHVVDDKLPQPGEDARANKGFKWPFEILRQHLSARYGPDYTESLFTAIHWGIVNALESCPASNRRRR